LTPVTLPPNVQFQGELQSSQLQLGLGCVNSSRRGEPRSSISGFSVVVKSVSAALNIPSVQQCDYLSGSVEDQVKHVTQQSTKPIAWTILDRSYSQFARDQREQLRSVGFDTMLFVSIENGTKLARKMCQDGLAVVDFQQEFQKPLTSKSGNPINWTLKLRVAKAKFSMPSLLHSHSLDSLFTEMDVFWLRNPSAEFMMRGPEGKTPSLIFGAHADKPGYINIGMWYVRGDAPVAATDLFKEAFEIQRRYPNGFDQDILQKLVIIKASTVDATWTSSYSHQCNTSQYTWCVDLAGAQMNKDVTARILDNFGVASCYVPEYDETTLAVHIISDHPLSHAGSKVQEAKLFGVFQGVPEYYEVAASDSQYLAWEGQVKSSDVPNLHGNDQTVTNLVGNDLAIVGNNQSLSKLVTILLKLGMATGRTVVLPQELDREGQLWHAEEKLDVQKMAALYGDTVQLRESTFLHNKRLGVDHMYPIAQLAVAPRIWAGMKITSSAGAQPKDSFLRLTSGNSSGGSNWGATYMQALVTMLQNAEVKSAKTVLLNFPLGIDYDRFNSFLFNGPCNSTITQLTAESFQKSVGCTRQNARKSAIDVLSLCNHEAQESPMGGGRRPLIGLSFWLVCSQVLWTQTV